MGGLRTVEIRPQSDAEGFGLDVLPRGIPIQIVSRLWESLRRAYAFGFGTYECTGVQQPQGIRALGGLCTGSPSALGAVRCWRSTRAKGTTYKPPWQCAGVR